MDILKKSTTLLLNRHWMPLKPFMAESILTDMFKETIFGLDITYFENPDGSYDMENVIGINPTKWEEWIKLPVRSVDFSVNTPHQQIRIPTVAVCAHYDKLPKARPRLCLDNIARRDNGRCQYTGKKLSKREMTLDHRMPKSRGGATSWKNLVLASKKINMLKADRTPEEAGLKLLKEPVEPNVSPIFTRITCDHPSWKPFLIGK